jgi:hypothetical protein
MVIFLVNNVLNILYDETMKENILNFMINKKLFIYYN